MNEKLISVILPIYNIKDYIAPCMNSIMNQTYRNLEIIMVDDGSTDGCYDLCDEYGKKDSRIVVYHKENGGLSDARNYGIERANGEYIACIDPDDFVDLDYIAYLYELIVKYNSKMSLCQTVVHYDNGSKKVRGSHGDEAIDNCRCLERMLYHDVIDTSAWGKLYHKDLFADVKYPKGKIFEDIGTTYALMLQCDTIAVGYESKYHYIFHNNSIVNGAFKPAKFDLLEMTDKMAKEVVKCYPELKRAVARRQMYARISTLNQMLNVNGYDKERKEIIDYIKKHKKEIVSDPKCPKRDRAALFLLSISYPLYRKIWMTYQKSIMAG